RDIDQELLKAMPASPVAQMNLAFDLGALSYVHYQTGDYTASVEAQRANVSLREKIVAANPDDFRAAERLAYALQFLADAEGQAKERTSAIRDYSRAIELYARLHSKGTLVQTSLMDYARSIQQIVHLEKNSGRADPCMRLITMLDLLKEYEV